MRVAVRTAAIAAALCWTAARPAAAERVELYDNSVIFGDVVSLSDDVYVIRARNGTEFRLPRGQVRQIAAGSIAPPAPPPPPTGQPPGPLRFSGSDTIGRDLIPWLAEGYVGTHGGSQMEWSPDRRAGDKTMAIRSKGPDGPTLVRITARDPVAAFAALKDNRADMVMTSRPIGRDELIGLAGLGDLSAPENEHVIALDGVAVIVHPSNRLRDLDKSQLARILSGEVKDWSVLGGAPGPIRLYLPGRDSGTLQTVSALLAGGRQMAAGSSGPDSTAALADAVAADPAGLGLVGLAYIRQAKPLAIRECRLAYAPTPFAVKTEEYPLARRLYLYTAGNASAQTAAFARYAASPEAQLLTAKAGFVDLSIEPDRGDTQIARRLAVVEETPANLRLAADFLKTTQQATRLSVTFRFQRASSALDSRAVDDAARLAAYLKTHEAASRRVLLLGYSDADGDGPRNLKIAASRAAHVASLLRAAGIPVALVKSYGALAPVACEDEGGRERNRRVEVWLQ